MTSRQHRNLLEPAWLLHYRAYRDSSLILEMFTRNLGRVGLVARGARRSSSRQRALLQPFTALKVSFGGNGELATLTGVEADAPPLSLTGTALMAAYYANELLLRLLARNDEHSALFDRYSAMLLALADGQDISCCLRGFERTLLDMLGYGLNLDHDIVDGQPIDVAAHYEYVLEHGPRRLAVGDASSGMCFAGKTLLDIRDLRLDDAVTRRAARRLFAMALDLYLGPAPLKSRQVLRALLRRADDGGDHNRGNHG